MNWLTDFFHSDSLLAIIGFWLFSAFTQSLPEPLPNERWYGMVYKFVHTMAANVSTAFGRSRQVPGTTIEVKETKEVTRQ